MTPLARARAFCDRFGLRLPVLMGPMASASPPAPEAVGEAALPDPLQRAATGPMRDAAARAGDAAHMKLWAGQAASLARAESAGEVVGRMWREAQVLLA